MALLEKSPDHQVLGEAIGQVVVRQNGVSDESGYSKLVHVLVNIIVSTRPEATSIGGMSYGSCLKTGNQRTNRLQLGYNVFRNATTAACSSAESCRNPSRARAASPPCERMAASIVVSRPSCKKLA